MINLLKAYYQWSKIQDNSPDERPKRVFRIINLLGDKRLIMARNSFLKSSKNVSLLNREETLSKILKQYNRFENYPEGSLGKEYYNFMRGDEVDYAKFITAYKEDGTKIENKLHKKFDEREKDLHDLIHIIFGYTRSRFGEGATLVTQYWQGGATGLGMIMFFGVIRTIYKWPSSAKTLLIACKDIYKRQKNIDLRSYPFEDNLDKSIGQIRKELGVSPPTEAINICERFTSWSWTPQKG